MEEMTPPVKHIPPLYNKLLNPKGEEAKAIV